MGLLARFPRLAAWVVALALVSMGTLCALQGLQVIQTERPSHLEHVHGIVVATQAKDQFAVRVPGNTKPVWFRIAPGAHISLTHIQRHIREKAPTDIYYEHQQGGLPLAWIVD